MFFSEYSTKACAKTTRPQDGQTFYFLTTIDILFLGGRSTVSLHCFGIMWSDSSRGMWILFLSILRCYCFPYFWRCNSHVRFRNHCRLSKGRTIWNHCFFPQYTEDPTFNRHGLTPVTVLEQATSGLTHLHSLNIGKMVFFLLKDESLERFTFEWKNQSFWWDKQSFLLEIFRKKKRE